MEQRCKKIFLALLFHLLLLPTGFTQIMHLSPVSFDDIQINPCALSTSRFQQILSIQQFNSYTKSPFVNQSKIQFTKKLFKPFMGMGISAQQTVFKGNSISSFGLSFSYSTILFNLFRIRAGATGSAMYIKSNSSIIDFYEQNQIMNGSERTNWLGNLNVSFALSFMENRYYLSYSKVNGSQFQNNTSDFLHFNNYHIVQLGNLLGFNTANEINHLSFIATLVPKSTTTESIQAYFTKLRLNIRFNRKSNLLYGGTFGWHSNGIVQLIPNIGMAFQNYSYGLQFNYFSKSQVNELSNLIGAYFSIRI